MNYLIIAVCIAGLILIIFLLKVAFRKDTTYDSNRFQNVKSYMNEEEIYSRVKELLASEKKIEAIKLVRENKKINLWDAKKLVESIEKGNMTGSSSVFAKIDDSSEYPGGNDELTKQIKELLLVGKKIDAIKLVVQNKKLGLKEAKDFVEQIEEKSKN